MSTAEQWVTEVAEAIAASHDADEQAPTDPVELDGWFDYQLSQLREIEAEMQRNRDVRDVSIAPHVAAIERADEWLELENAKLARSAEHIQQRMRQHALAYDFGKKKSRSLPGGVFGFRRKPAKLDVEDADAAIRFADAHDIDCRFIPARVEPDKKALKEYAESTGITPDGCTLIPATDQFYAEPTK